MVCFSCVFFSTTLTVQPQPFAKMDAPHPSPLRGFSFASCLGAPLKHMMIFPLTCKHGAFFFCSLLHYSNSSATAIRKDGCSASFAASRLFLCFMLGRSAQTYDDISFDMQACHVHIIICLAELLELQIHKWVAGADGQVVNRKPENNDQQQYDN